MIIKKAFYVPADSIAVSICSANSSRSTRTGIARVRFLNTSLVFTNVTGATVGINYTFWAAPGDGVWFWDQTGLTSEILKICRQKIPKQSGTQTVMLKNFKKKGKNIVTKIVKTNVFNLSN